jgi:chromatin segregation and condensation protein Rec8/ScpA/Scc1 (kleisin family)
LQQKERQTMAFLHENIFSTQDEFAFNSNWLSDTIIDHRRRVLVRFFYQMLSLKTRDYLEVKQEEPYGDIHVSKTVRFFFFFFPYLFHCF